MFLTSLYLCFYFDFHVNTDSLDLGFALCGIQNGVESHKNTLQVELGAYAFMCLFSLTLKALKYN